MRAGTVIRLRLAVALACVAWNANAATGSAAADTFYFRPAADCANNGDGMAFACAASAGATGAWRTSAAVVQTATTGVDDGDTLKGCGDFVEADLDTGAYFIFLPGDGRVSAANEAGRIRITGDCSAEGGRSYATVTGGSTMTIGFGMSVSDFITLENFRFYDINQMVGNTCNPASSPDAPLFRDLMGRGITNAGAAMSFNGTGYLAENIDIETVGEPIFICNGTAGESTGTVRHAHLTITSATDPSADGIQQATGGGAITLEDIDVYKSNNIKGCGLVGSTAGAVKVDGFRCHYTGTPGADVTGLAIDGSAAGGYARGVWSNAPGVALLLRDDNGAFGGAFEVSAVAGAGASSIVSLDGTHASGALTLANISGWATGTGIVAESGYNPLSTVIRNVAIDAPVGIDVHSTVAASDIDIDYSRWGPNVAAWKWRGTTDTTLAAYKTTSGQDAAATQGGMGWIGGPNPTTARGFHLKSSSPLIGAGTCYLTGSCVHRDFDGRRHLRPPNIGAFATGFGDQK